MYKSTSISEELLYKSWLLKKLMRLEDFMETGTGLETGIVTSI